MSAMAGSSRKTALLLGAGHAHLHTVRRAAEFRRCGFALTLIAPGPFWYSGLATGMLGGTYPPELDQIDVATLVRAGGGQFIEGRAAQLLPAERAVILESGERVCYDVLSVNVGSEVGELRGAEGVANVHAIKPLENLWRLRRALEVRAPAEGWRVVVVGGGASGGEIALNVRAHTADVTVLAAGERLFEQFAPPVAEKASRLLRERGVKVRTCARVERVEPGAAVLASSGERVPFDFLVNAAGLRAPALLRKSGLPTDEDGALRVNAHLQSLGAPEIFGGGDGVAFADRALAKIGVYAIRQSPVLFRNLLATLAGEPLRVFKPQRSFLLILNLGGGDGLAIWRRFSWHGRGAFWLKDYIDRRFLTQSRKPYCSGGL